MLTLRLLVICVAAFLAGTVYAGTIVLVPLCPSSGNCSISVEASAATFDNFSSHFDSQVFQTKAGNVDPVTVFGPLGFGLRSGNTVQTIVNTTGGSQVLVTLHEESSSYGSASYGTMWASTEALASAPGPANATSILSVTAGAGFRAIYQDTVFVTSPSLPFGTPVQFEVYNHLLSDVYLSSGTDKQGQSADVSSILDFGFFHSAISHLGSGELNAINPKTFDDTQFGIISTSVGAVLPIEGQLIINNEATASFLDNGPAFGGYLSSVDVPEAFTADTFLTVLTPGATFHTASGALYAQTTASTPEPGTFWTMLVLIALFAASKARKVLWARAA